MEQLYEQYIKQLEDVRGVQLHAVPLYDTLTSGISQDLPVLFQLMGGKMPADTLCRPMNMAIVLDRSGSMDGSKLENSKKAVKKLIGLLGDNDRLHFVIYDENVDTVFVNVNKDTAESSFQKVDAVRSRGVTNLLAGVTRGVELVKKYSRSGGIDAVLLFSDGLANSGVQGTEAIGMEIKKYHTEHDIRFSAFGIGDDFDELLMTSIARCGKGNYFYIDDMERIPELVQKARNGFVNIIAEDLVLKVTGVDGSVLVEMDDCDDLSAGRKFRTMREYGFYQVLTKIRVTTGDIGTRGVLRYKLMWVDRELGPQQQEGVIEVNIISDFNDRTKAPEVVCYQTMRECGALNTKVTQYMKERNRHEVIKLKEQVIRMYAEVVELDKFGFILALLTKERKTLALLRREGITNHSTRAVSSTSSVPGYVRNRCDYETMDDEDDEDMGFGLFD